MKNFIKQLLDFAVMAGLIGFALWFWWGFLTIGLDWLASLYK